MKAEDIKQGGTYLARIGERDIPVRVDKINRHVTIRKDEKEVISFSYDCTDLKSGRVHLVRSPRNFKSEVEKKPKPGDLVRVFKGKHKDSLPMVYRVKEVKGRGAVIVGGKKEHKVSVSDIRVHEGEDEQSRPPQLDGDARSVAKAGGASTMSHQSTDVAVLEGEQSTDPTLSDATSAVRTNGGTGTSTASSAFHQIPRAAGTPSTRANGKKSGLAAKLAETKFKCTDDAPHLIVEARAGTGKTTTLVEGLKRVLGLPSPLTPSPQQAAVWEAMELSKGKVNSIAFCAFNKSIATELQSRVPPSVAAMTMHSMGFKAVKAAIGNVRVESYRVNDIISELLERDIRDLRRDERMAAVMQGTEKLVGLCKMNLIGFHPDYGSEVWVEELDKLAAHYDIELNGNRDEVYALVPRVLQRCKDVRADMQIDFNDMIWLPVVLNLPLAVYDLLLVDEAQDMNRCQQALAKRAGRRLILCGDKCQPPETQVTMGNGTRKRIDQLREGDTLSAYCPKDARTYNNRKVLGVTAREFDGEMFVVTTESGKVSNYTPNHHCYASFGPLRDSFVVYLMRRGNQFRIGSCQLNYGTTGNGIVHRLRTEGGDDAWILEVHETKREARLREMELSHAWNLPQVVFKNANQGYILDDAGINRFWESVGDNYEVGEKLLASLGLSVAYPIAVVGQQYQQSFKRPALFWAVNLRDGMLMKMEGGGWEGITVTRRKYRGLVYSLSVSHDQLYTADGIVTHNCQAIYGFAGADTESLDRMAKELSGELPTGFKSGGDGTASFNPARGCLRLPLTVTRRCGRVIVEEAKKIVPDFEGFEGNGEGLISRMKYPAKSKKPPKAVNFNKPPETETPVPANLNEEGKQLPADDYSKEVRDGDFIICRVNAPLVSQCFRFLKAGRKATIQGRDIGQGLVSLVKKMKASSVEDLCKKLSDWYFSEQRKENAKRNPSEARMIALSDKYDCLVAFTEGAFSVDAVIQKIEAVFVEDRNVAGIKLSSIHRAKGLEAERVFFLVPEGCGCPHPMARTPWQLDQEWNLKYVGITRAIKELIWVQ